MGVIGGATDTRDYAKPIVASVATVATKNDPVCVIDLHVVDGQQELGIAHTRRK